MLIIRWFLQHKSRILKNSFDQHQSILIFFRFGWVLKIPYWRPDHHLPAKMRANSSQKNTEVWITFFHTKCNECELKATENWPPLFKELVEPLDIRKPSSWSYQQQAGNFNQKFIIFSSWLNDTCLKIYSLSTFPCLSPDEGSSGRTYRFLL